ncbi:hypothetical protein GE061_017003 [Apolygus lucorum]|uniref:Dynein regulatory complex protein 1 C-terminal domain-containing protein n=1 Tax=Apolygus lucorum TaxID=248454 RepID=A0A6A4K579_APOLU|nr:hypothetical protein GE061_017003 [Apolygus lucorum]
MESESSQSARQDRLPPIVRSSGRIPKGDDELLDPKGLDESTVRDILKVGIDGRDKVDTYLVSKDPEIRKFCRRIRIIRRLQASQSLTDEEKTQKSATPTENQLRCSTLRIEELIEDSLRSITNVRVAAIKNEEDRQRIEIQRKEEIDTLIREEAVTAQEKFEEINSKWEIISKMKDPLEIHEETEKQRDDCVALLEQKDVIIDNLKGRLKQADQEFYDELAKQNDYINILSDRINEQISLMGECFRKELHDLQQVINTEKDEVLEERVDQWREMSKMKEWLELENISKILNYLQQYEEHIDTMLIEQHELMRSQKMRIETRLNKLTLEESRFRSAVLINSELLNYNVQILQKRQEENRIIKGHQKRIVNKLQETVRRLRQQQNEEINELRNEKIQLLNEMKKSIEYLKTAKERLKMLAAASDKRYFQLWDYNEEIAEGLVNKLLVMDRKFHRDLLNSSWYAPEIEFSKSKIPSYNRASNLNREQDIQPKRKLWQHIKDCDIREISSLIVQTITERNEFLMDHNLKMLIEPFSDRCRNLITVHHVFETLGLRKKEDVDSMVKYFIPYINCRQCRELQEIQSEKEEKQESTRDCIEIVSRRLSMQLAQMSQISKDNFMDDDTNFQILSGEVEYDETREPLHEEIKGDKTTICKIRGHHPVINFYHVSKALKEFVTKLNEERRWEEFTVFDETTMKNMNVSRRLSKREVESYWEGLPKVFPQRTRLLWRSLLTQIKDYYRILLRRNQLQHETKKLQKQSIELRRLLMRYLQKERAREKGKD